MNRRCIATVTALIALVGVALAGCTLSGPGGPVPPQPPMLEVQLADYDFVFDDPVPSGRLVVEVANVGEAAHELVLAPMPDGAGGDVEELVASEERRLLSPIYSTAQHQPGETGRFAVNLGPGRYLLACFLADDGGTPHYEKGMLAELTVE